MKGGNINYMPTINFLDLSFVIKYTFKFVYRRFFYKKIIVLFLIFVLKIAFKNSNLKKIDKESNAI
jgi:hypothetical protein